MYYESCRNTFGGHSHSLFGEESDFLATDDKESLHYFKDKIMNHELTKL